MSASKPSDPQEPETISNTYEDLKRQIQAEWEIAEQALNPKIKEWRARLKLYNNQMRDQDRVGDTTLFSVFQTVLANLYQDQLISEWSGRTEGDEEVAENLNALSEYDYTEMEKDITDYDWDWDTLFFGKGILAMVRYVRDPDKNVFVPLPEVWDPLTFLRDPFCHSINGGKFQRDNAARFFGRPIMMTEQDMINHPDIDVTEDEFKTFQGAGELSSKISQASRARARAQGRQTKSVERSSTQFGANREVEVVEWFTHFKEDGKIKKVRVWLVNDNTKIIGKQDLKFDYWAVFDRSLYRTSHEFNGTSIPDLVEDKQRLRAVAINLGVDSMKTDLHPHYLYDSNKISNKKSLQPGFNKFSPVDVQQGESIQDAVVPMRKSPPNLQLVDYIMETLRASAEKATATSEVQQGMLSEEDKTLGEINLATARGTKRYSLGAKIFGWSEKRFWRHWYQMYKEYFSDEIDEKVIRIEGAFGPTWRPLTKKDLDAELDPDVKITALSINRAKELEERRSVTSYFSLALSDPTVNRRYGLKKLGKLHGMDSDEIERLFPPTIDERIAEHQNQMLNEDEMPPVLPEDDHNVHLEIHSKAKETDATFAHIKAHEEALRIKKTQPELFPEEMRETAFTQPGMNTNLQLPTQGQQQGTRPITQSQASE